jgi:hypothetical protein
MVSGDIAGMAIEPVEPPNVAQNVGLDQPKPAANQWPLLRSTSGPIPAVLRLWIKVHDSQETILQCQMLTR